MPLAYDSNFGEKTGDHLSSHPLHELYQSTLTLIGASGINRVCVAMHLFLYLTFKRIDKSFLSTVRDKKLTFRALALFFSANTQVDLKLLTSFNCAKIRVQLMLPLILYRTARNVFQINTLEAACCLCQKMEIPSGISFS